MSYPIHHVTDLAQNFEKQLVTQEQQECQVWGHLPATMAVIEDLTVNVQSKVDHTPAQLVHSEYQTGEVCFNFEVRCWPWVEIDQDFVC